MLRTYRPRLPLRSHYRARPRSWRRVRSPIREPLASGETNHQPPHFPCGHCERTFRRMDALYRHAQRCHRELSLRCEFAVSSLLRPVDISGREIVRM